MIKRFRLTHLGLAAAMAACAAPALADPCKAVPDRGPAPRFVAKGVKFAGPVVYVGDGDGLCVAAVRGRERDPDTWVEVRLQDFYAPELNSPGGGEAKAALEHVALRRRAVCVADKRSYDRIVARCSIGGRDVGVLLRRAGVAEGGRAYPGRR